VDLSQHFFKVGRFAPKVLLFFYQFPTTRVKLFLSILCILGSSREFLKCVGGTLAMLKNPELVRRFTMRFTLFSPFYTISQNRALLFSALFSINPAPVERYNNTQGGN